MPLPADVEIAAMAQAQAATLAQAGAAGEFLQHAMGVLPPYDGPRVNSAAVVETTIDRDTGFEMQQLRQPDGTVLQMTKLEDGTMAIVGENGTYQPVEIDADGHPTPIPSKMPQAGGPIPGMKVEKYVDDAGRLVEEILSPDGTRMQVLTLADGSKALRAPDGSTQKIVISYVVRVDMYSVGTRDS